MSSLDVGLRKVVIGVNLVRCRGELIDRSSRLPLRSGAHVTLVHVLSRDATPTAEAESLIRLRALGAGLLARRHDVSVDAAVRRGDPVVQLAGLVDDGQTDLLVLGRGSPRGLFGMSRGTTAERVALRADVPVLVVGAGAAAPYRTMLAAIESPGEASARCVDAARRMVDEEMRTSDIVHALDNAIERRMQRAGAPHHAILMARRWLRSRVRAQISSWLDGRLHAREVRIRLESGEPDRVILGLVERTKPDLLLVGSGRRWLRRRVLRPSVVGAVLGRAECDVLLVRSRRDGPAAEVAPRAAA